MYLHKKYKINDDLKAERDTCTFNTEELTNLIDGNAELTKQRRKLETILLADATFSRKQDPYSWSNEEVYERIIQTSSQLVKKLQEMELTNSEVVDNMNRYLSNSVINFHFSPFFLHLPFRNTILTQGSEEQIAKWIPLVDNYKLLGSYAQTELGHGTDIRRLETTATYDSKTKEFVLHSPTKTSIKFWPGSLAHTCNFAIVVAQLYTKGECHGIHTFIVQVRNLHDHTECPGVTLGNIGSKMGMNAVDNSFAKFDNVRIPRENMLMGHAQVLEDGTYIKPENPYASLSSMTILRLGILLQSGISLSQSSTIAIRYSAVRRQGKILSQKPEVKILDYPIQQFRLFPQVAMSYAFIFTFQMSKTYFEKTIQQSTLDNVAELHGISSGLKALSTRLATTGIEQCRLACGGLGYWQATRLPGLYNDATPSCTFEGDNYVLLLQTARFLMKSVNTVVNGQGVLSESVQFLKHANNSNSNNPLTELARVFQNTSRKMIFDTAEKIQQVVSGGMLLQSAWQLMSVELIDCSLMFCKSYMMTSLNNYMQQTSMSNALGDTLMQLFEFLGLFWIYENSGFFLQTNNMPGDLSSIYDRMKILMKTLRGNIVALVDSFDYKDEKLFSIIGCYDGEVYERIYDYITNLPINKQKVHPVYGKYLKTMFQSHL